MGLGIRTRVRCSDAQRCECTSVLGHRRGEPNEIILVHSKRNDGFIDLRELLRHAASVCSIVARIRKRMLFVRVVQPVDVHRFTIFASSYKFAEDKLSVCD